MPIILTVVTAAAVMFLIERLSVGRRWPRVAGWWGRALALNGVQVGMVYIVVITEDERTLVRSSAMIYLLRRLGGLWRLLGWLLWGVPRPLRNAGYDLVGRLRYRLFGTREDVCPIIPAEYRARFFV